MKQLIIFLTFIAITTFAFGQQTKPGIAIIPEPVSMQQKAGQFKLGSKIIISGPDGYELEYLKQKLATATGRKVSVGSPKSAHIVLSLSTTNLPQLGSEGYQLQVTARKITVTANQKKGIWYGIQTILQLFPAEIESIEPLALAEWSIPCVEIEDYPRMQWRGLMLDVSRHFFTVDEVKRHIDSMLKYKYNLLHLHLTDDEGWRMEIKSYPKLTEVGAWRVQKTGHHGKFSNPLPDEPKTYGGFYTQNDLKELIRYAAERHIDILPEIDVPGHSLAAVVSYPELSCTEGAEKYMVRAGEPIIDWSKGSPPHSFVDNTLCPANEKVYEFLDKVFQEVAAIFPFPYIHVGGDEAAHNFWKINPAINELMQRENLQNYTQVQAYFEKRVEKIIRSKGKKMMGWDEILGGELDKETALMCWRDKDYAVKASKSGHLVVMSPTSHVYIDQRQADLATETQMNRAIRLNRTYQFDPVPEGADAEFILGGQANLWTENVYTFRQVEYQTWPRGFAVAESLWSPPEKKNWTHFVAKTEQHFKRLEAAEVKYSPAIYDPIVTVLKKKDKYFVQLATEIDGLDIYTSFDNSSPDRFYPPYREPLEIPKDAMMLRIITYRGKQPIGRLMTLRVDELKNRIK
jgi:hexosaminidase